MKKENRTVLQISRLLLTVFLPFILLMTILQFYTFNIDFYLSTYEKNNVQESTGMGMRDLERVTIKLMDYLKDREENLDIQATIRGEMREIFGDREKLHMIDVKQLFLKAFALRKLGFLLIAIALMAIYRLSNDPLRDIYKSVLWSGLVPLIFALILLILMQIDFNKYFTHFHEIFFDNDLWLLDPEKEVLIQMVPLEFFIEISTKIFSWFLGIQLVLSAAAYKMLRSGKIKSY
ncbi:TIGR01906 family membrane protein [Geosporobacter ferrireducens]|uniref:TIGR01906 family membrane protein n=1 Tax=Geosporobacter ferrireducens TaxID=1424294 RepID=UPI00139E0B2B|nr:TIGR01906 family membrane protein [Geosporobacter ferrireducens]MTI56411.1 TIGR01906 family membrane protein [Geosporobacter ferrireducens]